MGIHETIKRESNWGYGLRPVSFVKSCVHVTGVGKVTAMEPVEP